ncbi:MAG: hypothetical protein JWP91_166 [Fibrobacteres bacterium]|nr:hypothetical protein [Fibrobacterota bacterium]
MMRKVFGFLLLIASLIRPLHASFVQARQERVRQPDGSLIPVTVTGDEFFSRITGPEGCAIVKDPRSGWYDLARLDKDGSGLESRGIHYAPGLSREKKAGSLGIEVPAEKVKEIRTRGWTRRERGLVLPPGPKRSLRSLFSRPSAGNVNGGYTGSILGLTLLIDFPDVPANHSAALVDTLMNGAGYSRPGVENTVYEYYAEVSGGKLQYKNVVMPYWYRAPHPRAHYEDLPAMHDLIREVLAYLDARGMDFSRFTVDADGQIRALNVLYAGGFDGVNGALWPHTGVLENGDFHADGVFFSRHQITGLMVDYPYVGTICHENGHMLMGWPDLYDPDGGGVGVGPYSIMGFDNWAAPQRPDAALRYWAGWDEVVDITAAPSGVRFTLGANQNRIYRFRHPTRPEEYFLVDARPTRSRHWPQDHGGLAIWHVDRDVWNNDREAMTEENHYKVSLEQSNGLFNLEAGHGEDNQDFFFHAGTRTVFHDGTLPNSRWWSGDESHLHLTGITAEPGPDGFISFEMGAWPALESHTIRTVAGTQGQVIPLPAPCNLPHGAEGAMPTQGGNFGTVPQPGDRLFLDADGSAYAVTLTSASPWWLGWSWQTPYQGTGSLSGACSVLRGGEGAINGSFEPQGPLVVTTGRTQTFNFFPHAGYIIQDVRIDGVSVGSVASYTLHDIDDDHLIEVEFVPGLLLHHLTVQGENGPGTYEGTGDHPAGTWVDIAAHPFPGFEFDHWITTFGHVTVENARANPTRVLLNSAAVVLAVYNQVIEADPCAGVPDYVDGKAYRTGDAVVNGGRKYSCTVGGWCAIGGPYAPGQGWAWENAWEPAETCR